MSATTYSPTHFRVHRGPHHARPLRVMGWRSIGPAGLNLRRFAGVSEAGARSRNPEHSLARDPPKTLFQMAIVYVGHPELQ